MTKNELLRRTEGRRCKMLIKKMLDPRMLPDGLRWQIQTEGRGRKDVSINIDSIGSDEFIVYHKIKYGTEFSLKFAAKNRFYYGRIIRRTDDEIEFEPMTKQALVAFIEKWNDIGSGVLSLLSPEARKAVLQDG